MSEEVSMCKERSLKRIVFQVFLIMSGLLPLDMSPLKTCLSALSHSAWSLVLRSVRIASASTKPEFVEDGWLLSAGG